MVDLVPMVTEKESANCSFVRSTNDLLTLARLHHKRKARGEGVTGLLSLDHFECFGGLARKKVCWMVGYGRRKVRTDENKIKCRASPNHT